MFIKLLLYFFLIQNSFDMLIFPFKTAIYNKNSEINQNNKKYNATNYLEDNFYQPVYTTIKIGNPPQDLKALLSFNNCGFKIGKDKKCIYNEDYLSYYKRNNSKDFKYIKSNSINNPNGELAEDSIYAYTDLTLTNLQKFENIEFLLETDTNDLLCGIIGFDLDTNKLSCNGINNFIDNFRLKKLINSYNWYIKYNSENEGILVFDPELDKIIEDYNPNNLVISLSLSSYSKFSWSFLIDKVLSKNNKNSINKNSLQAEINNDFGLIEGDGDYYYYIISVYFKELINVKKCFYSEIQIDLYYYYAFECDKEKFGIEDMKHFPILSLVSEIFKKEFTLDYKDLFTETKYKYFFNIIFNRYILNRWILGKPFIRKYPMIFNNDLKSIGYYNENFKTDPKN